MLTVVIDGRHFLEDGAEKQTTTATLTHTHTLYAQFSCWFISPFWFMIFNFCHFTSYVSSTEILWEPPNKSASVMHNFPHKRRVRPKYIQMSNKQNRKIEIKKLNLFLYDFKIIHIKYLNKKSFKILILSDSLFSWNFTQDSQFFEWNSKIIIHLVCFIHH